MDWKKEGETLRSVKDLKLDMLELSENSKALLETLSFEEVVIRARRIYSLSFHPTRRLVYDHVSREARKKRIDAWRLTDLYEEMGVELKRLGMIRERTERLQMSANILALTTFAKENFTRSPACYFKTNTYYARMLSKMDNEAYECWSGFDDETVKKIKQLLRDTLSDMDYQIVSMRFGLENGKYASRDEVAQRFGWVSANGGPRYHEYKIAEQLHAVADELISLTEIS